MSGSEHIVLVGLPGTGKSTVAPLLAARLGRPCRDTDADVEARLGLTVPRVFTELGEARFRAEERVSLDRALGSGEPLVIAAGGGLVAQPGVVDLLGRRATVVLLEAADGEIVDRLRGTSAGRPLLAPEPGVALHHLRGHRRSAHAHAQLRVATGGRTPDEVAGSIAAALAGAIRVGTQVPYLVRVGAGVLDAVPDHVPATARRVAVICDEAVRAVADRIAARVRAAGVDSTVIDIPGGERAKEWLSAGRLLEECSQSRLERGDCVVAVGGGSIGDVAGMVAALYLRGIAWVVVPTTLLAMVDSAVGGKTAVNLHRGKNLAGVFWQPRAVVCDPDLLATLPDRNLRSAFAEVVKCSMIGSPELQGLVDARLDAALARDVTALSEIISGCCTLKAGVVAADERETGLRAILNYGHTVGHAVETLTAGGLGLDHGEAVAFGMRVAGALSVNQSGCPAGDITRQDTLLDSCGLVQRPELSAEAVAAQLGGDKKAHGGVAHWVLLRGRGQPVAGIVVPPGEVDVALREALAA